MPKNNPLQSNILEMGGTGLPSIGSEFIVAGILRGNLPSLALPERQHLRDVNIDRGDDNIYLADRIPTLAGL